MNHQLPAAPRSPCCIAREKYEAQEIFVNESLNSGERRDVPPLMKARAIVPFLLTTACSVATDSSVSATPPSTASTSLVASTTTLELPSVTSGHLFKLDPLTLETSPGVTAIPLGPESQILSSANGLSVLILSWDGQEGIYRGQTIDIATWEQTSGFSVGPHHASSFDGAALYTYDQHSGDLAAVDVKSGQERTLGRWLKDLSFWDGLHVAPSGLVAAVGLPTSEAAGSADGLSIFTYNPGTGTTGEHPLGVLERTNQQTGVVIDGEEIAEVDTPGLAWGDDSLFVAHADGPDVTEVDLKTGEARTHRVSSSSWLEHLAAFWFPPALAKGPTLGTHSSAALSPDDKYLFVSGNRSVAVLDANGLVDQSEHLGVVILNTESFEAVDAPELAVQFVREVTGGVLAVDTTSIQPWMDDYFLLTTDESGHSTIWGPVTVAGGGCELMVDGIHLLCSSHGSDAVSVELIDMRTSKKSGGRSVGLEDVIYPDAVLVDWLPSLGH